MACGSARRLRSSRGGAWRSARSTRRLSGSKTRATLRRRRRRTGPKPPRAGPALLRHHSRGHARPRGHRRRARLLVARAAPQSDAGGIVTRLARWMLSRALPPDVRDAILADLDAEDVRAIRPVRRRPAAWIWYWRQAAGSIGPAFAMRRRRRTQEGRSMGAHAMQRIAEAGQDARFALRLLLRQQAFTAAVVAHARARPRRDHGDLQRRRRRAAAPAAVSRRVAAGARLVGEPARGIPRNAVRRRISSTGASRALRVESALGLRPVRRDAPQGVGGPMRVTGACLDGEPGRCARRATCSPDAGCRPSTAGGRRAGGRDWRERLWRDCARRPHRTSSGCAIVLDGRPSTIVGVMPGSFVFPSVDARLWTPLGGRMARAVPLGEFP